nr:STAS-like domain-containing protein [Deinococcus geothermalis]
MSNYFGEYAENKAEAIKFREKHLMPALREGKNVKLDFSEVKSSPHSFLNAMLADAVALLGESCFRRIKIINAEPDIRDAIDYIFEDNLT